jgi:hypothetical protein
MSTPELHLKTLFILNDDGRILSTREPGASRGPLFSLVRGATGCAWAVRVDLPPELASKLDHLAQQEPPTSDFRAGPVYADRYLSLLDGRPIRGRRLDPNSASSMGRRSRFLIQWLRLPVSWSSKMSDCLSRTFEGGSQVRLPLGALLCWLSSRMGARLASAFVPGVLLSRQRQVWRRQRPTGDAALVPM